MTHFCSMKITQDARDTAAAQGVSEQEALAKGMQQKAVEFVKKGRTAQPEPLPSAGSGLGTG